MPSPDFDLTGHRAVITGGTSGIGLEMARGLLAAGASVALWGRDEQRGERARGALESDAPGRVHVVACDVSDEAAVEAAFARSVELLGAVDSCFANAGVATSGARFTEMGLDDWRRVNATNVEGAFLTLRAAARHMVARGEGGSLVATSSLAARDASPRAEDYSAGKAAVEALVRGVAVELARHGIRANALVPGWVTTPLAEPMLTSPPVTAKVLPRVPMRRWGKGDDFRGPAVFLASRASAYMTGQALVIDGGYSVF